MGKIVALFVEKKIKCIEFYRSETFGKDVEEIWCELECQVADTYTMNLYRRGVVAYSSELKKESSPLWCFLNGKERPIKTHSFKEEKTKVASSSELHRDVLRVVQKVELLFEMEKYFSPLIPSPLYAERNCKSDKNINRITIEYTNGSKEVLEMDLDSDLRMSCARDLDVIPTLYNCFIGPYKLRKITEVNLSSSEARELDFMKGCSLYTPGELKYITDHMFRNEKGTVFYTTANMIGLFTLNDY